MPVHHSGAACQLGKRMPVCRCDSSVNTELQAQRAQQQAQIGSWLLSFLRILHEKALAAFAAGAVDIYGRRAHILKGTRGAGDKRDVST
jgi:hypothetical protein